MKIFINFNAMKFESLKKLSLGKKIVIATINVIISTSFWNNFSLILKKIH